MSSSPGARRVPFEVLLPVEDPRVLEGFEVWMRLGLLSEQMVRRWARLNLSCDRPVLEEPATAGQWLSEESTAAAIPVSMSRPPSVQPQSRSPQSRSPQSRSPQSQSPVERAVSQFMSEIGVIWLLLLGVFLVVVSSAVLAASQWQNFSAVGQYLVLFAYTIAFGGAALWTDRQERLQVTSQMLKATTLLIVPVNFWVMDGFGLLRSPVGLLLSVIAAGVLFALQWQLLERSQRSAGVLANLAGLSVLQWGWGLPVMPMLAPYIGTVGSAIAAVRTRQIPTLIQIVTGFGTLLLIGRATLVAGVPLSDLGLALGLCGGVLCWEGRSRSALFRGIGAVGTGLIVLGWLLSLGGNNQVQALSVSAIALVLLWDRLQRRWESASVVGLIAVGTQGYWLMNVLLPESVRSAILQTLMRWTGATSYLELSGLISFPVVLAVGAFSGYLKQQQKAQLAQLAGRFAIVLGILFWLPSCFNPAISTVYFTAAFAFLLGLSLRKSTPIDLAEAWLIHGTGVIAFLYALMWQSKPLGLSSDTPLPWAMVLIACTAVEWLLSMIAPNPNVRKTAWAIGWGFAALGYLGLWTVSPLGVFGWGGVLGGRMIEESRLMVGWIVPVLLAVMASLETRRRSSQSPVLLPASVFNLAQLSMVTTLPLMTFFPWNSGWFGLSNAIAVTLYILNTRRLKTTIASTLTVGLTLLFVGYSLSRGIERNTAIAYLPWLGAIVLSLWVVRRFMNASYAKACDIWAIALLGIGSLVMFVQTGVAWLNVLNVGTLSPNLFFKSYVSQWWDTLLLLIAIAYRTRLGSISGIGMAGLMIGIEFLIQQSIQTFGIQRLYFTADRAIFSLAIVHLALVYGIQIATPLLRSHYPKYRDRLTDISTLSSLGYGAIGLLAAYYPLAASAAWQGWYAMGLSLPLLFMSRSAPQGAYAALAILYLGLYQVFARNLPVGVFEAWGAAIATVVAGLTAMVPWLRLGWQSVTPMRNWAIVLPGAALGLTVFSANIPSLLLTGGFYAWLSYLSSIFKLSYLSAALGVWAAWRWLGELGVTSPLWYVASASAGVLCLVDLDPSLQSDSERGLRHQLRMMAIGAVMLTAIYQVEVLPHNLTEAIAALLLSFSMILAGLLRKTRAYLYVGTIGFVWLVLRQLWIFIGTYSLMLWALGITVGIGLIWIAATFESRRAQAIAWLQAGLDWLAEWE